MPDLGGNMMATNMLDGDHCDYWYVGDESPVSAHYAEHGKIHVRPPRRPPEPDGIGDKTGDAF